jgi:hypothetical protein
MSLTETTHAGGFILAEANGTISREAVTILSGQNLAAGAVLGKVTASGKYKAYDNTAADGSEVAAGVLYAAVNASSADAPGVALVRHAEVNANELGWAANDATGVTAGKADLKALNILVR